MTATEVLRRLLDERGVEYRVSATGYSIDIGPYITAYANRSDTTLDVSLRQVTPEQAIAATLGAGTCHIKPWKVERDTGFYDCMECECGYVSDVSDWAKWHHCPNCGRRIEQ